MVELPVYPGATLLTFGPDVGVLKVSYFIWRAIDATWRFTATLGRTELVVTRISDSTCNIGRCHFTGDAFDFQRWATKYDAHHCEDLNAALGRRYRVLLSTNRVHVEYNPAPRRTDIAEDHRRKECGCRISDPFTAVDERA